MNNENMEARYRSKWIEDGYAMVVVGLQMSSGDNWHLKIDLPSWDTKKDPNFTPQLSVTYRGHLKRFGNCPLYLEGEQFKDFIQHIRGLNKSPEDLHSISISGQIELCWEISGGKIELLRVCNDKHEYDSIRICREDGQWIMQIMRDDLKLLIQKLNQWHQYNQKETTNE